MTASAPAAFRACKQCSSLFYMRNREGLLRWAQRLYCSRKCARIGNVVIEPIEKRLDDQTIPVTESGCWIWLGMLDSGGYGTIKLNRRTQKAHRVSWEHYRGLIPDEIKVLHRCDIPMCINPDHLFLGTQAENIADMIAKGRNRGSPGEQNGRAKLTVKQVLEIRHSCSGVVSTSKQYGVSPSMISQIRLGQSWKMP